MSLDHLFLQVGAMILAFVVTSLVGGPAWLCWLLALLAGLTLPLATEGRARSWRRRRL